MRCLRWNILCTDFLETAWVHVKEHLASGMSWKIKSKYILWHRLFDLPVIALWYCCCYAAFFSLFLLHFSLQWRHNERYGVSNHWCLDGLLNLLFRRSSKKTPKLRVTGLCEGNSPVTDEFPSQRACNAEDVFIWWRNRLFLLQIPQWTCSISHNTYHS